jgi:rRNA biogenesis protein RRP5
MQTEAESSAPVQYLVDLTAAGGGTALGRLDEAHLADHPSAQAALSEAVGVGSELGRLLVLERMEVCTMPRWTYGGNII